MAKEKQEQIVHPFLNEKASIGILPHLQALLLARFLRGEFSWLSPSYPINKFYNRTPKLKITIIKFVNRNEIISLNPILLLTIISAKSTIKEKLGKYYIFEFGRN